MLYCTDKVFCFPVLKGDDSFIITLTVHAFIKRCRAIQRINEFLARKDQGELFTKMNPELMDTLWEFFKAEPVMSSHLLSGDNIFCVYENGEKTFLTLPRKNKPGLPKIEVSRTMLAGPLAYFWMVTDFTEVSEFELRKKPFIVSNMLAFQFL